MSYSVIVIHPVTGSAILPDTFESQSEAIIAAETIARQESAMVLVDRDQDGECQFVALPPYTGGTSYARRGFAPELSAATLVN